MRGILSAWLATYAVMGCFARILRYEDIVMMGGETCPHLDSCRLRRNGNFLERNCECDLRCKKYNDCCVDAPVQFQSVSVTREVCKPIGTPPLGAYMVATCPEGSESELADQCERDDFNDPFLSTPLTDELSNTTYLNSYCAQCNGAVPRLQPWNIVVTCSGEENYTWEDVTWFAENWTVRGFGCSLRFEQPSWLLGGPRQCRANLKDTCPPNTRRKVHVKRCKAYLAMVVGKDMVIYRNHYCALCNGNTVDDISCYRYTPLGPRKPFSYALLLDVNTSDGNKVGINGPVVTCTNGQKYDPFFKKCREIICGIPGYALSNGKCVKQ